MSVQLRGNGGTIAEVGSVQRALRSVDRPVETLSWISVGVPTGLITGLAAQAAIASLRNSGANLLLVRRVGVGFLTTTAFTTAQRMEFGLRVARGFTVTDSGQTALSFASNNTKMKTALATPNVELRVSNTGAITAGTRTPDTNYLGIQSGWSSAAGIYAPAPAIDNLLKHDPGDYPIVLAANEGLLVDNLVAMGAAGVGIGYLNFEIAEVATTEF